MCVPWEVEPVAIASLERDPCACTNKASLYPSSSLSTGHIHAWHLDLLVAADAKLGPAAAGVCEVIIQPRGLPLLRL